MFFRRCIDGGRRVEKFRFDHSQFDNCTFSRTDLPTFRSTARDVELIGCETSNCSLGPAILETVIVDSLKTHDLPICWGTLFKNVVLRGDVGRIKINKSIGVSQHPDVQRAFESNRERFYRTIDWALDFTEARFAELSIRGVPARLVRIDSESQGFVTRESAFKKGGGSGFARAMTIGCFVSTFFCRRAMKTLFLLHRRRHQNRNLAMLDSLNELKDLGVVLNQV